MGNSTMIYVAAVMAVLCGGTGTWSLKQEYYGSAFVNFALAIFWTIDFLLYVR